MILAIKYWLRYILSLCLITAVAFMVACTVLVIVLITNGDIRICMVEENRKKK